MDSSKYSDIPALNDYCAKAVNRFKFNIDLLERKYADRPTSGMVICFDPERGDQVEFDPDLCTSSDDREHSKLLRRSQRELGAGLRGTSLIAAPEIDDSSELKHRDIARYKRINKMFARLDAIDERSGAAAMSSRKEASIQRQHQAMRHTVDGGIRSAAIAAQSVAQSSRVKIREPPASQQIPKKRHMGELTSVKTDSDGKGNQDGSAYLTRTFMRNLPTPDDDEPIDIRFTLQRLALERFGAARDFDDIVSEFLALDEQ